MEQVLDILSWVFIVLGSAICLIGGVGLLRLKDMFARMHGASLIDTLGIGFILIGLMLQAGLTLITGKLILILIFIFFTSPTTTHALARAALNSGQRPEVENETISAEETDPSKT